MHQLVFAGYRDISISEPRRVFTVEHSYQPSKIFKLKPLDKIKPKEWRRAKGATSFPASLFKRPSEDGKTRDAGSLNLVVERYVQTYLYLRLSNL
jgi:hypothetical protein